MAEAVARLVRDGDRVSAACGLEARIPFAAGHEIVRQEKKDLTLLGPISDMLYDQLIGAGCVRRVEAAWVGNVGAGLGHNFRRAVEGEPPSVTMVDYSNLSYATGLRAAAEGVPFGITRGLFGTDIARQREAFRELADPFGGEPVFAVRAIPVDVAIVVAQRADERGNAHVWGNLGTTLESARAAERVLLIVEELVAGDTLRAHPNRVSIPGFLVDAVVVEPGAAHPSPVEGYEERDPAAFEAYHRATRTREGWEAWRAEWIDGVADRAAYLRKLGR
ncbi:MAG: CoA transferase subunit A [Candidatus Eremiobacteraeota bacterium]|nr:CoA transferase subunit A [Candidatus Eremiobacteraeota bacterium]